MRTTFRSKLMLIVGASILALGLLAGGSILVAQRTLNELVNMERKLIPKAELGPKLEAEFALLRQSMQDAVAAQDPSLLDAALAVKMRLIDQVDARGDALPANEVARLRSAVQDYYDAARTVSIHMIAGATNEALVEEIALMQARQRKAEEVIRSTSGLSKNELARGFEAMRRAQASANQFRWGLGIGAVVLVLGLSVWASRGLIGGVRALSDGFGRFAAGDFSQSIPIEGDDELAQVAGSANRMARALADAAESRERAGWLAAGQAGLEEALRGEIVIDAVARKALVYLSTRIGALAGGLYVAGDDGSLGLRGSFARGADQGAPGGALPPSFRRGEGLLGEAATRDDLWIVTPPPSGFLKIRSALGEADAPVLVFVPLNRSDRNLGVLEFALPGPCSEQVELFLRTVRTSIAIALAAARTHEALHELLEATQRQAERLSAQEEELRVNNHELKAQQEELRQANAELESQRRMLSVRNLELEQTRLVVQQKADEVARISTYKSQFLANMSHELRTPLNSMLVLSQLLAENDGNHLTPRQVDYCRTIHAAGQDLLSLINQVLDLAKIEAGRQEVDLGQVSLSALADHARRVFEALARDKGLELEVEVRAGTPETLLTDRNRLERILTNLLGNAIKFTDHGRVSLVIKRPDAPVKLARELETGALIAFEVKDTGIGIAPEDQERVFAAFEQIEARSDRRYGGTGLGLSIARESAILLGGELVLESSPGQGSTFTLYLPERSSALPSASDAPRPERLAPPYALEDDRGSLGPGEAHLLVIEDDAVVAEQLAGIVRSLDLKVVLAPRGQEGLRLARELSPIGIILDVKLPDIDGWTVLDRLKQDPRTADVPVHFVSAISAPERGVALGAVGYLTKPASRADLVGVVHALTSRHEGRANVLVVEDSAVEAKAIVSWLDKDGIPARAVSTAAAALEALEHESYGCMILDLGLPDMDGLRLLEALRERPGGPRPSVIVHTARALSRLETQELEAYVQAVVLKDGSSKERLMEEVRLFVGHVRGGARSSSTRDSLPPPDVSLEGVKLLLAEDDMRTVYALSALLRSKGADVIVADTGRGALEQLATHPDVRGVLMDIMMPEMDGYEAMRRLRADARYARLPVIALTARAMKGERERCLEAGASDYLSKPVDGARLLATLQRWLVPEERRVEA